MTDTKKSRGRPRKLDRAAAAQTAMELFWRNGYDGVGIADLTEALGVKSPSLYAAFGNKANIFAAALEAYDDQIAPDFAPAFAAQTVPDFTAHILTTAATLYTANPARPGCLVLDGTRNSGDVDARTAAEAHRTTFTGAMAQRLTELGAETPGQLADSITIAMLGLSGAARSGIDAPVIKAAASAFARTLA